MKAKKIAMILIAVCFAAVMLGCSNKKDAATGSAGDGTKGMDRELVIGVLQEPTLFSSLHSRNSSQFDHPILYNVFDFPFHFDTYNMQINPELAESWEFTPDLMQLKINIRDNVYFHNGYKLTAEDFHFTIEGNERMNPGRIGMNLDHVEIVDDLTVIIHFTAPYAPAINWMCIRHFGIQSKKYFDEVGLQGMQDKPIGTGPFKYVSSIPGNSITLERNEDYWRGPSQFKRVIIRTIPDINTMILALQSGEIDVVINSPIDNLLFLSDPNVVWDTIDSSTTLTMRFNLLEKSWVSNNMNFRKAVQHAVDKDAVNMAVYAGRGEVTSLYGSKSFTSRPPDGTYYTYTRDLDKAREYLKAANYNGQEFKVVVRAGPEQRAAEVIQGSLREAGINMSILVVDAATRVEIENRTGDFDALLSSSSASHLDFDRLFNELYRPRRPFYPNWNGPRQNEELDAFLLKNRGEPDPDKRAAGWAYVETIDAEDAYNLHILQEVNTLAWRKGLDVQLCRGLFYKYWFWGY
ncbi:ABC transporter substrate-binding protein [Breznakiella homolactica]|uniref:ABC transporter substrate-binding protein n=1 Tax=Breznakiella homolactica TaxID=2798577 RepID=A0A7T7XM08_9SPIR|nr:ABC transporter substrate-binding protein [Breznakiella homolactica]QQO08829.1 ABC transporter substrate-binding protein [Breznakiella homolactica]